RIAFFAVFAQISQFECRAVCEFARFRVPDNFVEAFNTAVEMVLPVIYSQLVFDTVQREAAFGDAISIATDNRAKVWMTFQVSIEVVEAKNDIVKLAVAVRDFERRDNATVVGDPDFSFAAIRQSVDVCVLSVRRLSETFPCYFGLTMRVKVEQQNHRAANYRQRRNRNCGHEMTPSLSTFICPKALAPGDDPEIIAGS